MKSRDISWDWKDNVTERRKWERHPPAKGVLAMLDGRSYRMLDISFGGFCIYDYGEESVPDEMIVGLHCFDEGIFVDAIRCRKVSDQRIVSQTRYGEVFINRIGLEIVEKIPDLVEKLTPFLADS